MRWLASAGARRRDRERGAVAIFVAILIPVLVGCAALTVDVGTLASGRRSLQNAADAVALSAAATCAKTSTCPPQSDSGLTGLADDNDSGSAIVSLCGVGTGLSPCDPLQDSLSDCPIPAQSLPAGTNFVRAYTQKKQSFAFAPVIGGGNSAMEQTCASVAWGSPGSIGTLPFTIGLCEWQNKTAGGTDFSSTSDIAIPLDIFYDVQSGCTSALPGGFGWLDNTDCVVPITIGDPVAGSDPGNGKGHECDEQISALVGSIVYIPVFSQTSGAGNGGSYTIYGLAAFYLDGIKAPSFKYTGSASNNIGSPGCPGKNGKLNGNACIWGYFVKDLAPVGSIDPDAPNLGLTVLQMTG